MKKGWKKSMALAALIIVQSMVQPIPVNADVTQDAMQNSSNAMTNTGFELEMQDWQYKCLDGQEKNWVYQGIKPEDSTNCYAGNKTFNFWFGGDTGSTGSFLIYQTIQLNPGIYILSGWSMGADGEQVEVYCDGQIGTKKQKDSGWGKWEKCSGTFTIEKECTVEIGFRVTATSSKAWGYVDELCLSQKESFQNEKEESVYQVEKVSGMSTDFLRGVDVSSYLSEVESGVVYRNFDGKELDEAGFFQLLAESGVNAVRLRVWNDPYDSDGNGYGGGNCDLEKAKKMGKWATDAGMKVLIDFHYSDFWADPSRQLVPKEWKEISFEEKKEKLYTYTKNSLQSLLDAGVNVGMVQVGNETNNGMAGETEVQKKCQLFQKGSSAVRAVAEMNKKEILVALHFTDVQKAGNYQAIAKYLQENNVDYDVFASSYYPFWHGTTDNLTSVLQNIAKTYHKKVMVAETSYVKDLEDHDGQKNNIGSDCKDLTYEVSAQGQVTAVANVMQAVADIGEAGVGVFYWEPAWIPVQEYEISKANAEQVLQENQQLWKKYGSGWATEYAKSYDAEHVGNWYGGSSWENQALFGYDGYPDQALRIFRYVLTGTKKVEKPNPPKTYTITFEMQQEGMENQQKTVTEKETYGILPVPCKEGYRFEGWYTKKEDGERILPDTTVNLEQNMTVYARWKLRQYKIEYCLNGGENDKKNPKTYTTETETIVLTAPQKRGYSFQGWYQDRAFQTPVTVLKKGSSKARKYYAKWKKIDVRKTVITNIKAYKSEKNVWLNVAWKKTSDVNGYEISILPQGKKKPTIVRSTVNKKKICGLKKGKSYQIKVRAYKKDSTGGYVYGTYSKYRYVKL